MHVVVVVPPSAIVSLAEAKRHLKVEHSDDDMLIESFIRAATGWLDGPAGWLGRALGVQTLEWQGSCWPDRDLPFPPHIELVSVNYVDPAGSLQNLPLTTPVSFVDAPAVRGLQGDVIIRYRAGYGALDNNVPPVWVNAVPAPIKVAILMLVAQWYAVRETVAMGATVETLPFGAEALLSPYRVFR